MPKKINPRKTHSRARTTDLHLACEAKRIAQVRQLLFSGASVNARDERGCTPLMVAAQSGASVALLQSLLNYNADLNSVDSLGRSAMYIGGASLSLPALRLLISAGADLDAETYESETALTAAVVWRRRGVVELLLHSGVDVNHRCRDGGCALYYAVYGKWAWGVRRLLRAGAVREGVVVYGMSLEEWAINGGSRDVIRAIRTDPDI
ncbi:MAG: ankyrin repeat domain-containing protein [Planctomycetales bacterium]